MIQITPHIRILLALTPIDFRKGIDGLAGVCRNVLKQDPFTGHMFIFRNKKGTSIKILLYDGQGYWLCQKRFSKGRLCFWPASSNHSDSIEGLKKDAPTGILKLAPHQLQMLLWNVDFQKVPFSQWKKIKENTVNF